MVKGSDRIRLEVSGDPAPAMAALRDYLKARAKAGAPTESDAPLFWHAKGG